MALSQPPLKPAAPLADFPLYINFSVSVCVCVCLFAISAVLLRRCALLYEIQDFMTFIKTVGFQAIVLPYSRAKSPLP